MELSQFDWLRIRSALLSAANDLAKVESDQELDYFGTYGAVRDGLEAMYGKGLGWDSNNSTATTIKGGF